MKTLYALLGAPGVGKTTFVENASKEIFGDNRLTRHVLGPDLIRSMVATPEAKADGTFGISQENEKYVWGIVNEILDKKTEKGELIIVDATHSRNKAITNYKKYSDNGYRIVLIDFSDYATLDQIFERNKERESFKFVPEHIVETMYERIKDLDIPNWVEVINPEDFRDHLTNVKHDWSEFKDITVIGDIHGCPSEFKDILDKAGFDASVKDTDRAIVMVGDYFDRGPGQVEVFKTIQRLQRNHYVLSLIGNHEEPLKYYKEFVKDFNEVTQQWIKSYILPIRYGEMEQPEQSEQSKSPFSKWLVSFKDWRKKHNLQTTSDIAVEAYEYVQKEATALDTPDIEEDAVYLCKGHLGTSYKKLDSFIEDLKDYPKAFKAFEDLLWGWNFNEAKYVKNTSRTTFKKFLLSDIKYTDIATFTKSLAQFCYVNFHGRDIVVTHGGLTDLPTKLTPTADMIRGVGSYEDTLLCDQTFNSLNPDVISIHGHRNTLDIPIESTPGTYNINGDVELGIRALVITRDGIETIEVEPQPSTIKFFRERQIERAKRFKAKKLTAAEEGGGLIRLFQDHTHVDVKRLPGDIASINFTRKAFEKGFWDATTVKARGLFLDIDTDDNPRDIIIARGYEKFFNLGERYGVQRQDVRNLIYPIKAYEKANGYLGILSIDNRGPEPKWFTASKTTTQGDYADNFRALIEPHLTDSLMKLLVANNLTLLFEVIDPHFDPHIETYVGAELVLLDAIRNQLQFKKMEYIDLNYIVNLMVPAGMVRVKRLVKVCEKASDFNRLVNELNAHRTFSDNGVEGYVFEDSAPEPTMFKIKSKWYNYWKYMRGNRDRVFNKLKKHRERGQPVELTKSEAIEFKNRLHTAEEIKGFKALVHLSEASPDLVKSLPIPELRKAIIATIVETED